MARRESPEIKKLRFNLRSPGVRRDDGWQLEAVQRVISLGTSGCDMSPLFPEMIMAGATTNLVQKKLVYLYLTMYAESNSELALLTVNTLHKDCQDCNPVIRSLALRALTSLKVVSVLQLMLECVETGLRDTSALVRRAAVMAVLKLFYLDQQLVLKNNLVSVLYQLLKDNDPQVVSNILCVLTEVLAGEGGMVVTIGLAHHLLNRLSDFSEWGSCLVLRLLRSYHPSSEQELLDILNVLDSYLSHSNSGVVLETVALFLHLTTNHPILERDVHHRIKAPLLTLLGSQCPELTYTCLQHIQLLLQGHRYLWSRDYKSFFCSPCWAENCIGIFHDHRPSLKECAKRSGTVDKNGRYYFKDHIAAGLSRGNQCLEPVEEKCSDYSYIKCKKMDLLSDICTAATTSVILNELIECAADGCVMVSTSAIKAIASIGIRLALSTELCVRRLLQLLDFDRGHVVSETLVALSKIALSCNTVVAMILPYLPSSVLNVSEPEGKAALIWMLGEYGKDLHNALYTLEEVINHISHEPSIVRCQLITSVTKLFFKRAPECQEMLGKLLEHCIYIDLDANVRDRALLYYRMLQLDVCHAERVVNCGGIVSISSTLRQHSNPLLCEFNTLAVTNGVASATFISQECPYSKSCGPSSKENALHWASGTITGNNEKLSFPENSLKNSLNVMENVKFSDNAESHAICILALDPLAEMSAGNFEAMWLEISPIREFNVELSIVPTSKELTKLLQTQYIKTMASSSRNSPVIIEYFYAQNVSTKHFFLVEICIAVETSVLSFTLKCQNNKEATSFVKLFFQTLGSFRNQLPKIRWRRCEDLPTCVKNIKGVFFKENLYLGGGYTGSSKADAVVYMYSPKLDMWKLLPPSPLKWFSIVDLNSHIVLVGGKETLTQSLSLEFTNKVASWDQEISQWKFSLPPMLNRRVSPIAISYDRNLIVAGGNKGVLDFNIEILNAENQQWQNVSQLPLSCTSLNTVWNEHWYFYRECDHTVIRISLSSLTACAKEQEQKTLEYGTDSGYNLMSYSLGSRNSEPIKNASTTITEWEIYSHLSFTPIQICTIQNYLVAISNECSPKKELSAFAYVPESNSWTNVGRMPEECSTSSFVLTNSGDLFLVGGDSNSSTGSQYSNKLLMVTIVAENKSLRLKFT